MALCFTKLLLEKAVSRRIQWKEYLTFICCFYCQRILVYQYLVFVTVHIQKASFTMEIIATDIINFIIAKWIQMECNSSFPATKSRQKHFPLFHFMQTVVLSSRGKKSRYEIYKCLVFLLLINCNVFRVYSHDLVSQ